jgi:thiol-disulfide isomerase/thioredoxin
MKLSSNLTVSLSLLAAFALSVNGCRGKANDALSSNILASDPNTTIFAKIIKVEPNPKDTSGKTQVAQFYFSAPTTVKTMKICTSLEPKCDENTASVVSKKGEAQGRAIFPSSVVIADGMKLFLLGLGDNDLRVTTNLPIKLNGDSTTTATKPAFTAGRDLILSDARGQRVQLSQLTGSKYTLIDVSQPECQYCRNVASQLQAVEQRSSFQNGSCKLVTVIPSSALQGWSGFIADMPSVLKHSYQSTGNFYSVLSAFGQQSTGTPTLFMIDATGNVIQGSLAVSAIPGVFNQLCP